MGSVSATVGVAIAAVALVACSASAPQTDPSPTTTASSTTVALTDAAASAVAEYRAYLGTQAALLVERTREFAAAVKASDVTQAKALFSRARAPYERIEPVAETIGDLDRRIDAREGDAPVDEWGGFHRIEQQLWAHGNTHDMGPVADRLVAAVTELQGAIAKVELSPASIADTAVDLLNEIGLTKVTGEEDPYSHTDLDDIEAGVDGARAALRVVAPLFVASHRALVARLDAMFDSLFAALTKYRQGDGYRAYTDLTAADTKALAVQVDALADSLSAVPPLVGTAP